MNKLIVKLELDDGKIFEKEFDNCNVLILSGTDVNTGRKAIRYDVTISDGQTLLIGGDEL